MHSLIKFSLLFFFYFSAKSDTIGTEVQVGKFTKALEGETISDEYLLDKVCWGAWNCTLLQCARLCVNRTWCKSLAFNAKYKACGHYNAYPSNPTARATAFSDEGWDMWENKDSQGGQGGQGHGGGPGIPVGPSCQPQTNGRCSVEGDTITEA